MSLLSHGFSDVTRRGRRGRLTAARRAQNRASQARYRLKQRRLARDSESATDSAKPDDLTQDEISVNVLREQFASADFIPSYRPPQMQPEEWDTSGLTLNPLDSLGLPSPRRPDAVPVPSRLYDINNIAWSDAPRNPLDDFRLEMQPLTLETFHTSPSHLFSASSSRPTAQNIADSQPNAQQQTPSPSTTFLFTNHIRLRDMTFLAATLAIAASIDVTADDYLNDRPSPFYLLSCAKTVHSAANYFQQKVKRHLWPSLTQLSRPHASYLDLIVFPHFRERAILQATSSPCLLDQQELFSDMLEGGLACWGTMESGLLGRGSGVPWDMRSWEAKPWFLKKWWFLLGGDDEMWEASRWWWEMRGEDADQGSLMSSWRSTRLRGEVVSNFNQSQVAQF
ncbi:hypothetical protein B0T10DRAFT_586469 [Thelonectria olida]|uniref:BZIP domain-containing protein n=1 Tax=Thelonectria olida TaxID=1576542 RepID=A0A9P8VT49_9HYPO|nr:hypothetical protein B0T10DRAFT_586469 [Thelonectria olida]